MGSIHFDYIGVHDVWTVPDKVTSVLITMNGGGTGTRSSDRVSGRRATTPGKQLFVFVGGQGNGNVGATGGAGAYPGGGNGGNGFGGAAGAHGGGGYSAIRYESVSGTVLCVAAGAGGDSGDGGAGGQGGAAVGQNGSAGTGGPGVTGDATGGTQTQGGNGGTSSYSSALNGANAGTSIGGAGNGHNGSTAGGAGGGGGGGGWRSGGGGQGGATGLAPAGGGAGGSHYTGGLTSVLSTRGGGGTGNGGITISWSDPTPGLQRPNTPTLVTPVPGTATKETSVITLTGVVSDPDGGPVRLMARITTDPTFATYGDHYSDFVTSGQRATMNVPVVQNRHYYVRFYAQDDTPTFNFSLVYSSSDFWTNRPPNAPTLTVPGDNVQINTISSVVFSWTPSDPDPSDPQTGAELRWQPLVLGQVSDWTTRSITGATASRTENPGTFKSNTFYQWTVRTMDAGNRFGPWAEPRRFYVAGTTSAPRLLAPVKDAAVDVTVPLTLDWAFNDPDAGDHQTKADVRIRPAGADDNSWVTSLGSTLSPGGTTQWTVAANTLDFRVRWEWQARTYDFLGGGITPSDWSQSGFFWGISTPGTLAGDIFIPTFTVPQGALGCGEYRVFVYDRGGTKRLGELTPLASLQWGRRRDDISNCLMVINGFGPDCGELLAELRSWRNELVVYRSGKRVWEGPITRVEYRSDAVEIEAKDVMAWVYRRIMRQGYNDAHPHTSSVVDRAARIIINALAPDDPNILPYLTILEFPDDARQSRVKADYSTTAWEEVDDLAATAGLDYTTVGRRIILWDTHRPIGRLPEMRDGDFSDPLVVTEYGMLLAGEYAVTNGGGVYGVAIKQNASGYYGLVELLSSAYGDVAGGADETLTQAARDALEDALTQQAVRNISARYPSPLIVRVPDNSSLNPDISIDIDQLVPGVWIPLSATNTVRQVSQWQKLDSMTVDVSSGVEKIQVVMSPAPGAGADPDSVPVDTVGGP